MNRQQPFWQQFNVEISENEPTEEICLRDEELSMRLHDTILLLQKNYLQSVQFPTDAKLKLQNRNRAYALNKLRWPKIGTGSRLMKLHDSYVKSPRFLHRTRNNQYASSVSNGSRTKCVKSTLEMEAKGQTISKFTAIIHPRALERRIRHEQVQRRREAFERSRKSTICANKEKNCFLGEKEKRQRIKDYVHKRHAEKEHKIMKAQQRMKFLIDLETAKEFDQKRLLRHVMFKFRNLIRWKIRNQIVSNEMRRQIILRNIFVKWRQHTICVWKERKQETIAFYNRYCLKIAWSRWHQNYLVAQSNIWTAVDWYDLRLSGHVFQAWNRVTAQTRHLFEMKKQRADAHFNWLLKWRVLGKWRRLHTILQIGKETETRRERWRVKVNELIKLDC